MTGEVAAAIYAQAGTVPDFFHDNSKIVKKGNPTLDHVDNLLAAAATALKGRP